MAKDKRSAGLEVDVFTRKPAALRRKLDVARCPMDSGDTDYCGYATYGVRTVYGRPRVNSTFLSDSDVDRDSHLQAGNIRVGVRYPSSGRNLNYESFLRVVYGQHIKRLYLGSKCENQLRLFWWYQGRTVPGRDL